MKIIVSVKGCHQVGPDEYQSHIRSFEFDSSVSIDEILEKTKVKLLSDLNLSEKE